MPKKEIIFNVEHDDFYPVKVTAQTPEEAGVAAARVWGVPWSKVAAFLDVRQEGTAYRRRCPACGREFFAPSAAGTHVRCPPCQAQVEREKSKFAYERYAAKIRDR